MRPRVRLSVILMITLTILVGCTAGDQPASTASPSAVQADPSPARTATPSVKPEPSVLLILGNPGDGHPIGAEALLSIISEMAASDGLTIERSSDPTSIDPASLAAVLAFEQEVVSEVSSQLTGKPILLITSGPAVVTGDPVFNLYFPDLALERQAMLAGYSAALITYDWRVAALTAPAEDHLRKAILQGASYMCGLCRPSLPPYASYPLSFQIEPGASTGQMEGITAEMSQRGVETVVVSPEILQRDLAVLLEQNGIQVIEMGSIDTVPAGAWAASVQYSFEAALAQIWPALLSGDQPTAALIPLSISDRNPDLFSDARLRLAEQAAREISTGMISPNPD